MKKYIIPFILVVCGLLTTAMANADETKILTPQDAIAKLGGPTLITMHLEDATPQQFYEALWKQANLYPYGERTAARRQTPLVSIDVEKQPFWNVVREFAHKTELGVEENLLEPRWYHLEPVARPSSPSGLLSASGPFLFEISGINYKNTREMAIKEATQQLTVNTDFGLTVTVYADPKISMVPDSADFHIDQVLTDNGKSLLENAPLKFRQRGSRFRASGPVKLSPQYDANAKIASLKGIFTTQIVTQWQTWEVPDLANAEGASHGAAPTENTSGDGLYQITKVEPIKDGYQVELVFERPNPSMRMSDYVSMVSADMYALDDKGKSLPIKFLGGRSQNITGNDWRTTSRLQITRGEQNSKTGPIQLVWKYPVQFDTVKAPFEFKGLALP